ncbi:MAG: ADOP family duplicated permease [Chthoniobacterales bacterium]
MNWVRLARARLFGLLHKAKLEAEMEEELRFHLAMRTQENLARGMSQPDALRAAERQFGNVGLIKEQWRDVSGGGAIEVFWRDLRFAARMLLKDRLLTVIAVSALALGIGANTALFTVLSSVLLRPLPYAQPNELTRVWSSDSGQSAVRLKNSYPDLLDFRARNCSFDSLGAFVAGGFLTNNNHGEVVEIQAAAVTSDIFPMLGAGAALGRIFSPSDDQPGNRSIIISDKLWEERFARAANVTDASLTVEGENYAIVGVMPRGFRFPVQNSDAQFWVTFGRNREPFPGDALGYANHRDARYLHLLGRLKPGRTAAEAESDLNAITADLATKFPDTNAHSDTCVVTPWLADLTGKVRPALLMLIAAAACLLGVACASVANLLLARGGKRRKEIAIRAALGAGQRRLARQLLTESFLLALVGGAVGLLLAVAGTRLLVPLLPEDFPRAGEIMPDAGVLAFTVIVTVLTSGIFGCAPAWHSARTDLAPVLAEGSGVTNGTPAAGRLRGGLVVAEIILSSVLLACACCLIDNVWQLQNAPLGLAPQHVLTARIALPDGADRDEWSPAIEFSTELLQRVRQLPGVASASAVSRLPAVAPEPAVRFGVVGREIPADSLPRARPRIVFPDYFRTIGIALKEGREFDEGDTRNATPVAIINESLAAKVFPNENAIGRRLIHEQWNRERALECEVIGVVGDTKADRLSADQALEVYIPYRQYPSTGFSLVIRSEEEDATVISRVRRIATELDSRVAFYQPSTLEQHLDGMLIQPRLNSALLAMFAIVAVVLTAIGVYGVMAFSVAQRRHEIGIRLALGAPRSAIVQLVSRESTPLILVAVVAGSLCSLLALPQLGSFLQHSSGHSYLIVAFAALVVSGTAFIACWLPARRAAREDPLHAIGFR